MSRRGEQSSVNSLTILITKYRNEGLAQSPSACNDILLPAPFLRARQHLRNSAWIVLISQPSFTANHTSACLKRKWRATCRQGTRCQSDGCADNFLSLLLFTHIEDERESKVRQKIYENQCALVRDVLTHIHMYIRLRHILTGNIERTRIWGRGNNLFSFHLI